MQRGARCYRRRRAAHGRCQPEMGSDAGAPWRRDCSKTWICRGSKSRCIPTTSARTARSKDAPSIPDRARRARLHDACVSRLPREQRGRRRAGGCLPDRRHHAVARSRGDGQRIGIRVCPHAGDLDAGASAPGQGDSQSAGMLEVIPLWEVRAVPAPDPARARHVRRRRIEPGASTGLHAAGFRRLSHVEADAAIATRGCMTTSPKTSRISRSARAPAGRRASCSSRWIRTRAASRTSARTARLASVVAQTGRPNGLARDRAGRTSGWPRQRCARCCE